MKDCPLFSAVDLGTTDIRSMIFNKKGKVLGQAFQKTKMYRPTTDAVEEDPEEILFSTLKAIRESVLKFKISLEARARS